jgi:hypothetical protein
MYSSSRARPHLSFLPPKEPGRWSLFTTSIMPPPYVRSEHLTGKLPLERHSPRPRRTTYAGRGIRKAGLLWEGGRFRGQPGLTIDQIVIPRRAGAHTPFGVSLYARWLLLRVFGMGQSEGPEPGCFGSSDPMREAGAPNTRKLQQVLWDRVCPPHRDSHARTADAPEQHLNGLNLRATLEVG